MHLLSYCGAVCKTVLPATSLNPLAMVYARPQRQCPAARGAVSRVRLSAGLGRGLKRNIPAGEYKHCRVTLERACKNLCPLYAEVNPAILDGGNGGLGNAGEFGKLALAQLLELAKTADSSADKTFIPFLGGANLFHIMASGSGEG